MCILLYEIIDGERGLKWADINSWLDVDPLELIQLELDEEEFMLDRDSEWELSFRYHEKYGKMTRKKEPLGDKDKESWYQ